MIKALKQEVEKHADRVQVVAAARLLDVKEELQNWLSSSGLSQTQQEQIFELYDFNLPSLPFSINSIVLVACPFPAYAEVEFLWQGKQYNLQSIVTADLAGSDKYLKAFAQEHKFNLKTAANLPVKRLAVGSGLAEYGKNNITYIEGMGSFFYYLIYFSDLVPDDDFWRPVTHAKRCSHCLICFKKCVTGAIKKDEFLLDTGRCLCTLNESPEEFPSWLSPAVHHLIYDCLKCQLPCPMNRDFIHNVAGPIKFTESETAQILNAAPLASLPPELYKKVDYLGFSWWWEAIPRNLKMMFELEDSGQNKQVIQLPN